ncbi:hypothetical protein A2116_00540 [Candidatus Jorgensenbacteria bacterium GWA1_49_17]|uniref:Cohesin domain-containing protein n=2 Tax=Candidatus Joergenseniibacteriota TaxID=1752739 RepID=A0A1F6BMA1_9BACT|nr:MAG: hypothetical protein A2127_00040 [Candidatus Jorgensenbacteria bacterium GWC1_48_12]OGG40653.1 MAG: hypothetical protein A2116_00540 [Candidatus Jorgensenbacteria bacterium GWA1_49_17]
MKNTLKLFVLAVGLFYFHQAFAVELYLKTAVSEVGVGEELLVDVIVDVGDETLNAVEGELVFPVELVKVVGVFERDSVITFWLEKPHFDEADGRIKWSGVTPGGFGNVLSPFGLQPARLFSIIFEGKNVGTGQIGFGNVRALRNDGEGTLVELTISALTLTVNGKDSKSESKKEEFLTDDEPPQEFVPLVTADPTIFDGRWFLIFNTQDKESGIKNYEVLEKRTFLDFRFWTVAESPYLLKDQNLRSRIYVKAIDERGNERVTELAPTYPLNWSENVLPWVIMIIILDLIVLFWRKFLWRKR